MKITRLAWALLAALALSGCTTTIDADDAFWGTTLTTFDALVVDGEDLGPLSGAEGWQAAQRYAGQDGFPFGTFVDQPTDVGPSSPAPRRAASCWTRPSTVRTSAP